MTGKLVLDDGRTINERMEDITPSALAPKQYRKALARVGGLNPYSEPLYRVVIAEHVMEWHGGEFWDWTEDADLHDQGGLHFSERMVKREYVVQPPDPKVPPQVYVIEEPEGMIPSPLKPVRVEVGLRRVQRYPTTEGWVLMRWRPASHWGSRALWEGMRHPGTDIQILGPYPEQGRYEIALEWVDADRNLHQEAWSTLPPISRVEEAVQFLEHQRIEEYGNTPQVRMLIAMNERKRRIEAMAMTRKIERQAAIRDAIQPYLGNSLAAQRLRNELAAKAGISEHFTI